MRGLVEIVPDLYIRVTDVSAVERTAGMDGLKNCTIHMVRGKSFELKISFELGLARVGLGK